MCDGCALGLVFKGLPTVAKLGGSSPQPFISGQSVQPVGFVFFVRCGVCHGGNSLGKDAALLDRRANFRGRATVRSIPVTERIVMLPQKKDVMLELLKDAWVYVVLDPRKEGVILPDHLRSQPRLVLQYGYNMPMPIHDLTIDDEGIKATLSFQRTPYATLIPWSAVFAMHDGEKRGLVWEEDVPKDMDAQPPPPEPPPPPPKPGKKPRPSHLKLVP